MRLKDALVDQTLFEFTAGTLKAGTFDPAPTGRVPENVRPGPSRCGIRGG